MQSVIWFWEGSWSRHIIQYSNSTECSVAWVNFENRSVDWGPFLSKPKIDPIRNSLLLFGQSKLHLFSYVHPKIGVPSAAMNSAGSNKGAEFHFHAENHGKQLQIVIFDCSEISRFAIVSRDFLRENEIPRLFYCPWN